MKRTLRILLPAVALLATVVFFSACESEKTGLGEDVLDVTPSYAKLKANQTVTLTAHGGSDYLWSLSDSSIGSLSSRHGASVVYTAQVCNSADTVQTVTVQSRMVGLISTNTAPIATGTVTILHRGTEE